MFRFAACVQRALLGFFAAVVVPAQAALVSTTTPSISVAFDSQLSGAVLIYDANFYNESQGRLVVLASGSSLRGPGVPTGGSTPSQSYFSSGDTLRDLVITMRINNATGAFVDGTVTLPPDNLAAGSADSWSYSGYITNFGVAENAGTSTNTFDARWFANAYDFSDVVANPSLGVPGAPQTCNTGSGQCGYGYLRIGAAGIPFLGGTGTGVNFGVDWVRGSGISGPNASLGVYDDNIAPSNFSSTAVSTDVFLTPVPIPGALVLFAGGLFALLPVARRRVAPALNA